MVSAYYNEAVKDEPDCPRNRRPVLTSLDIVASWMKFLLIIECRAHQPIARCNLTPELGIQNSGRVDPDESLDQNRRTIPPITCVSRNGGADLSEACLQLGGPHTHDSKTRRSTKLLPTSPKGLIMERAFAPPLVYEYRVLVPAFNGPKTDAWSSAS